MGLPIKDLIRIAVVDDDLSVCELVSNHINSIEKCKVVLQAGDGQELLDALKKTPGIDIAILDIMMPGMDGYSTAKILCEQYPEIRILFYTMCKNELAIARMAACGGHGVIQKGKSSAQFAIAIKNVMAGKYYFPLMDEKLEINGSVFSVGKSALSHPLNDVEVAFLKHCASELAYKEIADAMQISIRKLEYVRESVFKKMEIKSKVGLVLLALQSGIAAFPQRA